MRLFVALHLPPDSEASASAIQARLRSLDASHQIRWVPSGALHLTLKFLGEVPQVQVPEYAGALDAALSPCRAPRLRLSGTGVFPNLKRPRVVWLGLHCSDERLSRLQSAVEAACVGAGAEPENRAFRPHLTIARVRPPRGRKEAERQALPPRLLQQLETEMAPTGAGVAVAEAEPPAWFEHVSLMRSQLSPRGARYESLQRWTLPR